MKKNKKLITIYIVGILTLIVAIVGSTYAFFSATTSNRNAIQGSTASTDINLTIVPVSANINEPLIPQLTSAIQNAVTGTNGNSCVDANNNTVCKVYEITIENSGSAQLNLNITLSFVAETIENLRWGKGTGIVTGFSEDATYSKNEIDLIDPDTEELQSITLNPKGTANDTIKYYVVVYIDEINDIQTDSGSFYGIVNVDAAGETGISATFNA